MEAGAKRSTVILVRLCGYPSSRAPPIPPGVQVGPAHFYAIDHSVRRWTRCFLPRETQKGLSAEWLGGKWSKTSRERNVYFWRRCHKQKKSLKTRIERYINTWQPQPFKLPWVSVCRIHCWQPKNSVGFKDWTQDMNLLHWHWDTGDDSAPGQRSGLVWSGHGQMDTKRGKDRQQTAGCPKLNFCLMFNPLLKTCSE